MTPPARGVGLAFEADATLTVDEVNAAYRRLGFVTDSHGHAAMYLRPQPDHAR